MAKLNPLVMSHWGLWERGMKWPIKRLTSTRDYHRHQLKSRTQLDQAIDLVMSSWWRCCRCCDVIATVSLSNISSHRCWLFNTLHVNFFMKHKLHLYFYHICTPKCFREVKSILKEEDTPSRYPALVLMTLWTKNPLGQNGFDWVLTECHSVRTSKVNQKNSVH